MNNNRFRGSGLNELYRLARDGDEPAREHFFFLLRVRFLRITKHRVPEDDAEDVVQEGLRIVHTKLNSRICTEGTLSWCLSILRNVIGNYYQKQGRQKGRTEFDEMIHSSREEGVREDRERRDLIDRLGRGLLILSQSHPRCGVFFQKILASMDELGSGQDVPGRVLALVQNDYPEMRANSFYVALHRCRARLRDILAELRERGTQP